MAFVIPIKSQRSCDSCTKCCEGFLVGEAYGFKFNFNNPCKFKIKQGCSIYDLRPYNPCQTFSCYYKDNFFVPNNFRPDIVGSILVERMVENFKVLDVVYAGQFITTELNNWLLEIFAKRKVETIRYVNNGKYVVLSHNEDFKSLIKQRYNDTEFI